MHSPQAQTLQSRYSFVFSPGHPARAEVDLEDAIDAFDSRNTGRDGINALACDASPNPMEDGATAAIALEGQAREQCEWAPLQSGRQSHHNLHQGDRCSDRVTDHASRLMTSRTAVTMIRISSERGAGHFAQK